MSLPMWKKHMDYKCLENIITLYNYNSTYMKLREREKTHQKELERQVLRFLQTSVDVRSA
jgi:transposase-like protein